MTEFLSPAAEVSLALRALGELRQLSLYANGWPEGTGPGKTTESELEYVGWSFPGGADMVDAVNEMLERLGLQVPTPEDPGALLPDPDTGEDTPR